MFRIRCDKISVLRVLLTGLILLSFSPARADDKPPLPLVIAAHFNSSPIEVGHSAYRKFGFRIYNISLWTKDKNWDPAKPYALKLHYTHGVSKETMVDTVIDDIRDQKVADDATLARWQAMLTQAMPDVSEDDELIGLCIPGKNSLLFFNGKQIASIDDQALSKAFFNIWLGDSADEDMRNALLGRSND